MNPTDNRYQTIFTNLANLKGPLDDAQDSLDKLEKELDKPNSNIQQIMYSKDSSGLKSLLESIESIQENHYKLLSSFSKVIQITKFNQLTNIVQNNKHFVGGIYSNNQFLATGCLIAPKLFLTTGHYSIHQESFIQEVEVRFLSNLIRATYFNDLFNEKKYKNEKDLSVNQSIKAKVICGGFRPDCDFAIFELEDQPTHLKSLEQNLQYANFDLEDPQGQINPNPLALIHYSEKVGSGASGAPLFTPNGGIFCVHNISYYVLRGGCEITTILYWLFSCKDQVHQGIYKKIYDLHSEIHSSLPNPYQEIREWLPKEKTAFENYQKIYKSIDNHLSYDTWRWQEDYKELKEKVSTGDQLTPKSNQRYKDYVINEKKAQTKSTTIIPSPPKRRTLKNHNLDTLYQKAIEEKLLDTQHSKTIYSIIDTINNPRITDPKINRDLIFAALISIIGGGEVKEGKHRTLHYPSSFTPPPPLRQGNLPLPLNKSSQNPKIKYVRFAADLMKFGIEELFKNNNYILE